MTFKIPWYIPRWAEEAARGIAVAVATYALTAIATNGIPDDQQAIIALIAGALPIAWAALRTALNKTPLTPPDAGDTPAGVGAGG